jgi:hypothetical protein
MDKLPEEQFSLFGEPEPIAQPGPVPVEASAPIAKPVAPKAPTKPPTKAEARAAEKAAAKAKAEADKAAAKAKAEADRKALREKYRSQAPTPSEPEEAVKPWSEAEIQFAIILLPKTADDDSLGGRRTVFTAKTSGMPMSSRIIRAATCQDWLEPISQLVDDYRIRMDAELAKLAEQNEKKADGGEAEKQPETETSEEQPSGDQTEQTAGEAENTAEEGETNGQDSDA